MASLASRAPHSYLAVGVGRLETTLADLQLQSLKMKECRQETPAKTKLVIQEMLK